MNFKRKNIKKRLRLNRRKKRRINWKIVVRRRRYDLLEDCVESEKVGGVNMNWEHMEKAIEARNNMN